jgi:O-antigen/teichoic acid export membrane protein
MTLVQLGYVFSVVYKEPMKYFKALSLAFAVFFVAAMVLIPFYTSMGCALATFISCTVLSITVCVMFKEKLLPCLAGALKVTAVGIMFVPFLLLREGLIMNLALVFIAGFVYLLSLFVTQMLNFRELKEIVQAIRHRPEESFADTSLTVRM